MSRMSVRSTYSLDVETARLIRELAVDWQVSQAEVVRRAVRLAADSRESAERSPADVLAHYRSHPLPRTRAETEAVIVEVRAARREDDLRRTRWQE